MDVENCQRAVDGRDAGAHVLPNRMAKKRTTVRFAQSSPDVAAVEIVRNSRYPVIVSLYPILLGLGIVVSSYHVRPSPSRLSERIVLQRRNGGTIDKDLRAAVKAAIWPVVHGDASKSDV